MVRERIEGLPVENPSEVVVEGVRFGVWRQIQRQGLPNGDGGGEGVEERKRRAREQIRVMQEQEGGT